MTATAHALIGASLAVKVANPLLGIPLAILSHFIADLVPHWDAGTNHKKKTTLRLATEATFDVLLGFALVFLLFRNLVDPTYLFMMVIAAQLPDWLKTPSDIFGLHVPPFSWIDWLSHKTQWRLQLPWGLVTQIVVVGIMLALTLNLSEVSRNLLSFNLTP